MTSFRALLIILFIAIFSYTIVVVTNYGWILFDIFMADLQALNWSGQFNLDFTTYLILSGLWIAWRHKFSVLGIIIGLVASILGMVVFAPYLLYASIAAKGNWQLLFLGERQTVE